MTVPLPLPRLAPIDWQAREAEFEPVSHIAYEGSSRAFCGEPFKYLTSERPTDRKVCEVCDAIRESLGYPR